jgi:HlyD family secretion protein
VSVLVFCWVQLGLLVPHSKEHMEAMIKRKVKVAVSAILYLIALIATLVISGTSADAQGPPTHSGTTDPAKEQRWLASAEGRVEPLTGVIKVAVPAIGVIDEVLVKANDNVFAGEALIRLVDHEIRARLAAATAAVAMRKRARDKESVSSGAKARRKAEDAVAEAEAALSAAQSFVDKVAVERRSGRGSDADLDAARSGLKRAQDRLKLQRDELRGVEAVAPLPTFAEGELNIVRSEMLVAQASLDKMTIRAPISGTILQIDAKQGELASPSNTQPLVLLGDLSALRVRAEVDERDIGKIKVGQAVLVRPAALRGREIAGTVSFIAPLVEAELTDGFSQHKKNDVVEVLIELSESGSLTVGMNVDVYFR